MKNELRYLDLVTKVMLEGNIVNGRNGIIRSLPFQILDIDTNDYKIPLLTTRYINYKSIAGEYAAMIRGARTLEEFKQWGCGYWKKWADPDGTLRIDYGKDFAKQGEYIVKALRSGEHNRRMLMNFWDNDNIENLKLPCCFYSMQFYKENGRVHLLWNQRSADLMIGVPHDIIWAWIMLKQFAGKANLGTGKIKMVFGDAHIYGEHLIPASQHVKRTPYEEPDYHFDVSGAINNFRPDDLEVMNYKHHEVIEYELKE